MIYFVIDINGVLVKRKWSKSLKQSNENDNVIAMPGKNGAQHVFIRPYALELLKIISEKKNVNLIFWSSMTLEYMMPIVNILTKDIVENFSVMSQIDCTAEQHPEHSYKPLFVKDVSKIYDRFVDVEKVVFLDDSLEKMKYNKNETIVIVKEWDNQQEDKILKSEVIDNIDYILNK